MENVDINRIQLEALPYSELLGMANALRLDAPDNFNRNFLIGEILEAYSENECDALDIQNSEKTAASEQALPLSYNQTEIKVALRDPAWAFVYWDISSADLESLRHAFISRLILRISSFTEAEQHKPDRFFDLHIRSEANEQYVLIPSGSRFIRADLIFNLDGIIDILSSSDVVELPAPSPLFAQARPGKFGGISPILALSDVKYILEKLYDEHRELFP